MGLDLETPRLSEGGAVEVELKRNDLTRDNQRSVYLQRGAREAKGSRKVTTVLDWGTKNA